MAFVVLYDACVLYPAPLRDLLIRLGRAGLCQVKWTGQILDECFRAIAERRSNLKPEKLARSRELLERAILDVHVQGYENLIEGIKGMPDPDDRHVLAAAICCSAQVIVTFNLKDFPKQVLAGYGVQALHPDDFVRDLIDLDEEAVVQVVREQAAVLKNPPSTPADVLGRLSQQGLNVSAAKLRELLGV